MRLNSDQLRTIVKEKAERFVKELNGRYKEHVSDQFIICYIVDEFEGGYFEDPAEKATELAYYSCINLFETILERGCKTIGNGHHVAQDFCKYFENKPLTD